MNIDEAIKILREELDDENIPSTSRTAQALKLGIEALEWIKEGRIEGCYRCPPLLPGETEE